MSTKDTEDEQARVAYLVDAQNKAIGLFNEIEQTIVRSGVSEKTLSNEIHELGATRHGVRAHWHKRVIRSGPNTLSPFDENPPDRMVQPDDILIVDLGPVFEEWEADFGRTFVLGDDPNKKRVRDALEPTWNIVKKRYYEDPDMTGERLYDIAVEEVEKLGFAFGAPIAGHIVGSFPHERIPRDKISLYIAKGSNTAMTACGKGGHKRHWILEIHICDPVNKIQGFYEQLLTAE